MPVQKVNIAEKLQRFSDYWNPRVVGELNGQHVRLAKLKGEFVWHQHDEEDELFLVISGHLTIELTDQVVELEAGELVIIPKGTQHRPVAKEEVHLMLFEPAATRNTGEHVNERTRVPDRI